jgi:hypothetical protein
VPCVLNLGKEAILVLLGALLHLLTSGGQVAGELARSPAAVRLGDVVLPVLLDEVGQVLAVGRGSVWHIVVGEPALELSLVPLVVSCAASPSVRICLTCVDRLWAWLDRDVSDARASSRPNRPCFD